MRVRLTAGRRTLDPSIGVRIPNPQQMAEETENKNSEPREQGLQPWMQPWTVVSVGAVHFDTAKYNQCWGVIVHVHRLEQPTQIFTLNNIKTSFYFDETYAQLIEDVGPGARENWERSRPVGNFNTPEQALEEALEELEPALVKFDVAVTEEDGSYRIIELYDQEIKLLIGSLTEDYAHLGTDRHKEEVVSFIKDVMEWATKSEEGKDQAS